MKQHYEMIEITHSNSKGLEFIQVCNGKATGRFTYRIKPNYALSRARTVINSMRIPLGFKAI